ncbi:hypothetical protein MRX96_057579 [Rhipicephalus microplus]
MSRLVPLVCTELGSSGSEEKVSISCWSFKYDVGLLQSKGFSRVNLFFARGLALAAERVLPKCQHLTSLTVQIDIGRPGVAAALALLLESTTSLRRLKLFNGTGTEVEAGDDCRRWWPVVVALCHNNSLRQPTVSLLSASELMWLTFAESLIRSESIRYVTLAVERVSVYPALLDEIAEQLKTDKAEVARSGARPPETNKDLERVHADRRSREGERCLSPFRRSATQLVDLNEDCWRQIRQYLFLRDVKHPE